MAYFKTGLNPRVLAENPAAARITRRETEYLGQYRATFNVTNKTTVCLVGDVADFTAYRDMIDAIDSHINVDSVVWRQEILACQAAGFDRPLAQLHLVQGKTGLHLMEDGL